MNINLSLINSLKNSMIQMHMISNIILNNHIDIPKKIYHNFLITINFKNSMCTIPNW